MLAFAARDPVIVTSSGRCSSTGCASSAHADVTGITTDASNKPTPFNRISSPMR
jgi:hypothetical protein